MNLLHSISHQVAISHHVGTGKSAALIYRTLGILAGFILNSTDAYTVKIHIEEAGIAEIRLYFPVLGRGSDYGKEERDKESE